MQKKETVLVTGHSSWWKEKKYRKETAMKLKLLRNKNWRLLKKTKVDSRKNTVDTRIFYKYIFIK